MTVLQLYHRVLYVICLINFTESGKLVPDQLFLDQFCSCLLKKTVPGCKFSGVQLKVIVLNFVKNLTCGGTLRVISRLAPAPEQSST